MVTSIVAIVRLRFTINIVLSVIKVHISEHGGLRAINGKSTAEMDLAIASPSLNVRTERGNLELLLTLIGELHSNSSLVLSHIGVDVDLLGSVSQKIEGTSCILSCQFCSNVETGQGVQCRCLELDGVSVVSEIVLEEGLELLEEHATENGVRGRGVILLVQVLNVDVALGVSLRVNNVGGDSTQGHVDVISGVGELDLERPAGSPQVGVRRALICETAGTTDGGITAHLSVESGVNLVEQIDKLIPEVVWQAETDEVSCNHGGLGLVRVAKTFHVSGCWKKSCWICNDRAELDVVQGEISLNFIKSHKWHCGVSLVKECRVVSTSNVNGARASGSTVSPGNGGYGASFKQEA